MTSVIEDYIDTLPNAKIGNSNARGLANASLSTIPL